LGVDTTIVIPSVTPEFMKHKLESYGANVILHGQSFDDANELAMKLIKEDPEASFVHPFDDEDVQQGHTTIIKEIHEHQLMQNNKPAVVVTVCGGGGLLVGIIKGLEEVGWGDVPIVVSETIGADSLSQSLIKGELVTLPAISSIAKTLGAKTVCRPAYDLSKKHNVKSVVVSDAMAVDAVSRFADDQRTLVEVACGAGLACLYQKVEPLMEIIRESNLKEPTILVIVCGGNLVSTKLIQEWKEKHPL